METTIKLVNMLEKIKNSLTKIKHENIRIFHSCYLPNMIFDICNMFHK